MGRLSLATIALAFVLLCDLEAQDQIFDHSDDSRIWISGQINVIHQQHPSFFAKYSGENSFLPEREKATSRVLTLFTGFQATHYTDLLVDFESTGGSGLSNALGLAGFTNLDVVRNPTLGSTPYLARLLFHQVIPLGGEILRMERTPLSLETEKPEIRIEVYVGKLGMADFFDVNSVGTDSHLQFMNWTIDNNGAYDYAADTRGYTYGALVDFEDRKWAVRFAEALMPKVANGIQLDWNLRRARAENLEIQVEPTLRNGRNTTLRFLSYLNHANMGSYSEAIDAFVQGRDPVPDIEAHRQQGRKKYGFGFNAVQQLTDTVRAYTRIGWNEGRHESFAYTEVNNAVAFGGDVLGIRWHRPGDKLGAAISVNGISADHRQYLHLGGKGFLLGDGNLNYGHEEIIESYYTAHVARGVYLALDLQHITHPGYNRDRGPVFVPGLRLNLQF